MEAEGTTIASAAKPRLRVPARVRELAGSTWVLGAVVFLLTWGGGLVAAETISVDHSYFAGMNMAADQDLRFGTEIVVTYGPLGFLKSYVVFYEWTAALAVLYGLALHLALSVSLVWALRRNFGAIVSLFVGLVAAMLMRGDLSAVGVRDDAGVVVLAVIWAVAALSARPPDFVRPLLVYGGGAFAAIELLAKLNTGLVVLGVLGLAVIATSGERRRDVAAFAGTLAASLAALWFVSGQGVGEIGPFLSRSVEVISGYSSGALLDWEDRDYDYVLVPVIVVATAALAWVSTRALPSPRRAVILVIFAAVAFTAAKGGLVSHDPYHMATFFGIMLGLAIAFPLPADGWARGAALVAAIGITAATLITAPDEYPLVDPVENVANAADTVVTTAVPGALADEVAENRADLIAAHDIDRGSLDLLEGHTVHVDPSEASAVWAHELEWNPLPVFQPYIAWTSELDELNAEAMASPDGPERILRQNINALGRFPAYESPAAMIAMLCNFEPLRTTERWQVLGRIPDRCGEPEALGVVEAAYGERIPVPPAPPGSLVFARVDGVEPAGLERLRAFVERARVRSVNFDSGGARSSLLVGSPHDGFYSFVPATAGDGLILSVPPESDAPGRFRLSPSAIGFAIHLEGGGTDERFDVEFFSMPIAANSSAAES